MEKIIYDENNGLWYELQGDYYFPCLVPDEKEGITEQRKAEDQMPWIQRMIDIRNTAEETVFGKNSNHACG